MLDLKIVNGTIVTPTGSFESCIGVKDGKIVSISGALAENSDQTIDASGLLIFPGFIDAHVHFREPAGPSDESYRSGTAAAAAGGICTVFEMTGSKPSVLTPSDLKAKQKIASENAYVDYAFFGGAGMQNLDQIVELASGGIIGYKTYMVRGPECTAENDSSLLQVFEKISATKLTSAVHAEVGDLASYLTSKFALEGKKLPKYHPLSRPNFVESLAIQRAIELANFAHAKCHIVHLSTEEGSAIIAEGKKKGYNVTTETCPHYLLLNAEEMERTGPYAKVNPPLRTKKDQEALWKSLLDGTVDFIASDHAPHAPNLKEPGWEDIWKANAGTPGVETLAALMLTKANEGLLSFELIAKLLSESPARVYGTYPRKGAVKIDSDADFTLVRRNVRRKLDRGQMHSKAAFATIYEGWEITAEPTITIVRGKLVAKDLQVTGQPGYGKMLSPGK